VGDQKREAQVRAEAALAALTLQVAARTYTVVPPPLPPAPPPPPVNNGGGWGSNRHGWGAARARARYEEDDGMPSLNDPFPGWGTTTRRHTEDPTEAPTTLGWGQGFNTRDTTRTSPPWGGRSPSVPSHGSYYRR
jgi:hypothetical protein